MVIDERVADGSEWQSAQLRYGVVGRHVARAYTFDQRLQFLFVHRLIVSATAAVHSLPE